MSEWKEAIRERLEGHLPKQDANAITDMLADLFRPEDSIRRGQADAWSRVWGHICSTGLDKRFGPHENGINIALAVVDLAAGAASRPASDDLMRAVEALEREWTPQHIAKTPLDAAVVNVILALRHSARPAPDVDATRAMVNQEVAAAIIREAIEKARNA
jgi:hypothetical protein